jgi:hypothetical protein
MPNGNDVDTVPATHELPAQDLHLQLGAADERRVKVARQEDA